MDTAHKTDDEKKEYFDAPDVLEQKVTMLAEMIKTSKHFVAFTGAGISTSTGIPDFRSGINTVLPTGPGAWEKLAQKVENKHKNIKTSMLKAIPSPTHMSLVQLQKKGYLKFLISQNVDGLHRRSGFSPFHLAELHGNTNLEKCKKCGKEYLRDFRVRNAQKVHDHKTGRKCSDQKCKGDLYDSIINFGENLPEKDLKEGFAQSKKADLHLVLGSSLRVTPAADMPATTAEKGQKLVIINLQKTPLDSVAALRINAMCDDVMKMVMKKLGLDIPEFTLERRVVLEKTGMNALTVSSIDSDDSPYDLFKQIKVDYGKVHPGQTLVKAPFNIIPKNKIFTLNLNFYGHYGEQDFNLNIDMSALSVNKKVIYLIQYSPKEQKWVSCNQI
ncbi:hypothetical protein ABPG74_020125 [Tetrahymena malaccensis]